MTLQNFAGNGIVVEGTGAPGSGSTIQNNAIANSGGSGIVLGSLANPADGNLIQFNAIDANCGSGILVYGFEASATLPVTDINGNQILGNTITNSGSCGQTFDYGTPDGVTIPVGQNNAIIDNLFENNAGLPIDLAEEGVTPNDDLDPDGGPNLQQNYPILQTAIPTVPIPGAALDNGGEISGWLFSTPNQIYTLHFYSSDSCAPENLSLLSVKTQAGDVVTALEIGDTAQYEDPDPAKGQIGDGAMLFVTEAADPLESGKYVISTATDANNNTSEFGNCWRVGYGNTVSTRAIKAVHGSSIRQSLDNQNEVLWYKIYAEEPFSEIIVKLNQVNPAGSAVASNNANISGPTEVGYDIDIVGFKDIAKAYAETAGTKDLDLLASEFSPDAFDAAKVNGSYINAPFVNQANYLGSYINGSYINGSYINGGLYSADLYAGSYINGSYINDAYLNQADYNGSYINGSYINGSYINGSYINGSYINGSYINGNAYTAAQLSSVITASANDGEDPEDMSMHTYNNPGWYYVRVQGRQGAYNPNIDFNVSFEIKPGVCSNITENHDLPRNHPAVDDDYTAIILVDYARMGLSPGNADRIVLDNSLNALTNPANPNSIHAAIVDLGDEPEVVARNDQADLKWQCPYAKNIVADEIKEIIDEYRAVNVDGSGKETIENIVVIGSDNHVPFYRYPDQSGLGPESQYVVPVLETSTSFASLESDTFLGQDAYGATAGVAMKNVTMPIPEIPVGRLVETPQQIANMIDLYLSEPVLVPQSAFVSMYDFLIDGGVAVRDDLQVDLGLPVIELNSNTWTATDMKTIVNNTANPGAGRLFDIGYWAGHFSATTALAADYDSEYKTSDLMELPPNFYAGALIYSAGCHVGYNIVNEHAIPDFTPDNVDEPDWAAGMANMGATFIGGTGYQYGDDEFVEYSERLYSEFTRALRYEDEVSIGDAMVQAKKIYLVETPSMSGIHQKALLEATIFGLPMKRVNMPGDLLDPPTPDPDDILFESDLNPVSELPEPAALPVALDAVEATTSPGEVLGLHYFDLYRDDNGQDYNLAGPNPPLPLFTNAEDPEGEKIEVTYLLGPDGKFVDAGKPVLPLDKVEAGVIDDVFDGDDNDWVLRGVAWLGGEYVDVEGITPLVAAAATESSSVHSTFTTFVDFPQELFTVNRFDAIDGDGGRVVLNITPVQHRTVQETSPQTSRRREFKNLQFRLLYLPNDFMDNPDLDTGINRPDLSGGPDFYDIVATPNGLNAIDFEVHADVDPSAGMEEVWISYTTREVPTENGKYKWIPFFLSQNDEDSTLWEGTLALPAGVGPENVDYVVSGYSGVGMVTMSNNMGLYYTAGGPRQLTSLASPTAYPASGEIGKSISLSAQLTPAQGACTADLKDKPIMFNIGEDFRLGWTDESCNASAAVPLVNTPPTKEGDLGYQVTISFPGDSDFAPSTADTPGLVTVDKGQTQVTLTPPSLRLDSLEADVPLFAELKDMVDGGRPLAELTVTFIVTDLAAVDPVEPEDLKPFTFFKKAVITDQQGIARLGDITLPSHQDYKVWAVFGGTNTYKESDVAVTGSSLLTLNRAPDCSKVKVVTMNGSKDYIWPSNNKMVGLKLVNSSIDPSVDPIDPDGDPVTMQFLEIYQDEPLVGDPEDGAITDGAYSCSDAAVRSERDGGGDGRVYHFSFRVMDDKGAFCEGTVVPGSISETDLRIPVDHDQSDLDFIDGGALFNSLGESPLSPACLPPQP
jgi:hypothetical protein